jgi:DNA-binding CsgD family transcriptional regulator
LIEHLTPREREVLELIAAGRTTKELAAVLGITFKTAACHRQRVLAKCGAANTAELVFRAVQEGWIKNGNGKTAQQSVDRIGRAPDSDRIERVCEESRKYRALLNSALNESRELLQRVRNARAEFTSERRRFDEQFQELRSKVHSLRANNAPDRNLRVDNPGTNCTLTN